MHIFLRLFLFIVSIILQLTIAPLFSIRDITPDFILIMIISIAFQEGKFWGVIAGCSAGLLFDFLGSGFLGLSSLTKSIAAYVAGFLGSERMERQFGGLVGLLFVVLLIHDLIYFTILTIGTNAALWSTLFKHVLPTTIYTLIFLIIFHLVRPKTLWGSK